VRPQSLDEGLPMGLRRNDDPGCPYAESIDEDAGNDTREVLVAFVELNGVMANDPTRARCGELLDVIAPKQTGAAGGLRGGGQLSIGREDANHVDGEAQNPSRIGRREEINVDLR